MINYFHYYLLKYNFILLCFILTFISSFCVIQKEDYIKIIGHDIKIKLGELRASLSTIVIQIDLCVPFTYFYKKHFSFRLEPEIQYTNSTITYQLPYSNQNLSFKVAKFDPFLLCDINTVIPDYKFIINDNNIIQDNNNIMQPYISSSALSLAHTFIGSEYNLIDILYKHKIIKKRLFSIVHSYLNKPQLYLGHTPNKEIITKYKGTCNVNKNSVEWKCILNKIHMKLNNHEWYYNINDNNNKKSIAFFQTMEKRILVPHAFYEYLKEKIFSELIEKEICFTIEKTELVCRFNKFKEYNMKISFEFEEVIFVFGMNEIFQHIDNQLYKFIIKKNEYNLNNEWVFGTEFMKHMNMVFDYDKSVIEFYSNNIEITQIQNNIIKLLYSEICLLLCGVMLVLYFFKYNHKYN